jgi:hypothetical protein
MTKTERTFADFKRRIDSAMDDAIEAGVRLDPFFDYAAQRIEKERAILAARSPSAEARRRWESIGEDEPPSAILDEDRFPFHSRPEEHPEYDMYVAQQKRWTAKQLRK